MKRHKPGDMIFWENKEAIILELKDLNKAIIFVQESESYELVPIIELKPSSKELTSGFNTSHLSATDQQWDIAIERFDIIKPLIDKANRTKEDIDRVAKQHKKGSATIYRWLKRFEETRMTSSLIREKRNDIGKSRLDDEVEEIIQLHIQEDYLRKERISVITLYEYIKAACLKDGLTPPDKYTIYTRIRALDDKLVMRQRYSPKQAKQHYGDVSGSFPHQDIPYSVVQIDHTPVDLIIVDDEHRLPLGRPYLTASIDIATKMVGGFVVDLHAPSALTAGLCIAHSMSQKDDWLAKRNVDAEWPLFGHIQKIHVDNAKEFVGTMIHRACQNRVITLENRPKGQPNYGGHIERGFRTFMKKCQTLPGTTFSNTQMKAEYDSEGKACMTLSEFEQWLSVYLLKVYHQKPHKGICSQAPIQRYRELILGTKDIPGIGTPFPIADEDVMKLDFTPYLKRTIQRTGIVIDNVEYFSPVLRRWIGATEKNNKRIARKFIFARDPRSLKQIHFWDPEIKQYFPIPYKNNALPDISLWELKKAKERLKDSPYMEIDEKSIFSAILELREIEKAAIERTRLSKQSRATEKRHRRNHQKRSNDAKNLKAEQPPYKNNIAIDTELLDSDEIQAFDVEM